MYLDAFLLMGEAQDIAANPSTVPSTSFIDLGAASPGDDAAGCWFVVRVDTACNSTGSATVTFLLQHDTASGFGTAATVVSSGAIAVATLTAGYTWKIRIPSGLKRYIRGAATIATTTLGTGKVDMFIVKDADMNSLMVA